MSVKVGREAERSRRRRLAARLNGARCKVANEQASALRFTSKACTNRLADHPVENGTERTAARRTRRCD